MSHDDFEKDPLDDLAATLPAGETVLWQGRPHWPTLMRQALHIDLVAAYFAALLTWRLYAALASGAALQEALRSFIISASISLLAIGVLALIAWVMIDRRRLQVSLDALEAEGVTRRSSAKAERP